ncbi:ketosteroid isomerase-like protein [Microbacterium ginsengiterrae]|uniref:Ketosteroid isomerase-like protein n=1 Tax=Microbacterium ginsengiterrae TaxID=546115 RepID=A0A7W9CB39_9MICO|nr:MULTISPECIES: nuclear transport factor 2 family protein [Microbacterium]MBB5742366.1 ketosteroid isomerase-like protein [Microbacterium ginsengiterrae]
MHDEMRDRWELHDLALAYAEAIDAKDADAVVRLFTDDAQFHAYDRANGKASGSDEIHTLVGTLLSAFSATMHHVSGPRVEFLGPHNARGTVSLTAWHEFIEERPDGILWGRYLDDYVRVDGRWRIARRTLTVHGHQDFSFPWIAPA